jgi:NADH-quinone oxidoreductase subunit G
MSGDLVNMETLYIFKEFFNKTLDSYSVESRSDPTYLNQQKRENKKSCHSDTCGLLMITTG